MKTILFIHQSAELYGSDKTLFFLVKELPQYGIKPIVVLPEEGPLTVLLREADIEIIISPTIPNNSKMGIIFIDMICLLSLIALIINPNIISSNTDGIFVFLETRLKK